MQEQGSGTELAASGASVRVRDRLWYIFAIMLKYLAIFAIAAASALSASGQTDKTVLDSKQDPHKKGPATVVFQENYYQSPDQPRKPVPVPPKWYEPLEKPEWWLVIIAALTGGAICWQSIETRRAAQAARNAARASLMQANHLIASERAWLIVRSLNKADVIKPGSPPLYLWEIKNIGKTPARLIATQAVCRVTENRQLPEVPVFPQPVSLNERILAPGESMEFHTFWSDDEGKIFKETVNSPDTVRLLAYGYVKYLNVLEDGPCESRFCEDFIFALNDPNAGSTNDQVIVFRPNLGAPAAYTEHT